MRPANTLAAARLLPSSTSVTDLSAVSWSRSCILLHSIVCQHKSSTTPPKKSDCSVQRLCFIASKFMTENAYSLPTRKISILIRLSVIKMIAFGLVERKPASSKVVFWLSAKSLWSMLRCWLVCASVEKDGCILLKKRLKLIARITLATCFQISSKTAIACCPPDSVSYTHLTLPTNREV